MSPWIRLTRLLGIRDDERAPFFWLFTHSLFNGVCVAFLFTAAYALFLDRYRVEDLPWAYIATALASLAVVALFSRLERELTFARLLLYQLYFVLVFILTLWLATRAGSARWPVFLMFVSLAPFMTVLEIEYWGIAHRLFDLRQGKRLFNLVSLGGAVSSIAGFFLVPVMVRAQAVREIEDLLLFSAAGLTFSIMTVREISRRFEGQLETAAGGRERRARTGVTQLLSDRYFVLLALLAAVSIFALYVVDLSFLKEIQGHYPEGREVAAFLGFFYGAVKLLELLFKAFLSGRLVSQFGVRSSLMSLPVVVFVIAALAVASHHRMAVMFFSLVALVKLVWLVVKKGVYIGAFKVLYQPLRRREKRAFQAGVESTVSPLVTLVAGVLLLIYSRDGFDASQLLTVLLPLLAGWVVIVALVHREYRRRLLGALAEVVERGSDLSPVAVIRQRLIGVAPPQFEYAADVLAKVDPTAVAPALVEAAAEGSPELKVEVLERIDRDRVFDAWDAVELCAADDHPEVRAAAAATLASLQRVVTLAGGAEQITALMASPEPEERKLAALALGWSAAEDPGELIGLLWDRDPDVRRAALLAAGRLRDPRFWQRLITQLSPPFTSEATAALVSIGDPVLPELETIFGRVGQDSDVRRRILRIYERVDSPGAHELIVDKLRFPDRSVRHAVMVSLSHGGYRPRDDELPGLKNEIEELVGTVAWNLSAILDLGEDPATLEVREALEGENAQDRAALFRLLSLLFDSRAMALVRDNLSSTSHEAVVYALEIVDVMVSPDIKPMLFPVLEDLPPATARKRLDAFFPRQRLTVPERLEAITFRGYDEITSWTRACALKAITELSRPRVEDVLLATIFHPEPMVQEVAAGSLLSLDPSVYARQLGKLPPGDRERIERVMAPGQAPEPSWERRSVFGRVAALREVAAFSALPLEDLMKIAAGVEEIETATGDNYPPAGVPAGSLSVVAEGRLGFYTEAGGIAIRGPSSLVAFAPGAPPARVMDAGRVYRLRGHYIYELAAVYGELVPAILDAASPPTGQEVVSLSQSFSSAISFMPSQ